MIERLFLQIAQVGALFTLALGGYAVAAAGGPLKIRDLKLFPDTEKGHFGTPHKGYELPADQKRQLFILVFDKTAAGQQAVQSRRITDEQEVQWLAAIGLLYRQCGGCFDHLFRSVISAHGVDNNRDRGFGYVILGDVA